ncbi:TadE/TadG family type IV pilus assembly protein [Thalassobacillus hwangdonensis]|uniref:TadE/TadG family type IV pilus assembly protein n=1 Tax=Thalassobacillus hwangdonensis TaxID=546108 RepID=A0ABW3KWJ6_9BACI
MLKREDGSITLEAAMILPFFLLFVVFLATLIRIAVVEMTIEETVSETTEMVATHAYPITFIDSSPQNFVDRHLKGISMKQVTLSNVEKLVNAKLPSITIDGGSDFVQSLSYEKLNPIIQESFEKKLDGSIFDSSKLKVVDIEIPSDINGGKDSYLGLTVQYEMKAFIPFIERNIVLKKRGVERLWTGGPATSQESGS